MKTVILAANKQHGEMLITVEHINRAGLGLAVQIEDLIETICVSPNKPADHLKARTSKRDDSFSDVIIEWEEQANG